MMMMMIMTMNPAKITELQNLEDFHLCFFLFSSKKINIS